MAVTSTSKWACPTCTYNNWQSLAKCVLCGSSKPVDEVIPRTPVAKYRQQNSGWSKLGSSVGASQLPGNKGTELNTPTLVDSSSHGGTPRSSAKCKTKGAKWSCVHCTSLNWSNAGQCTSCGTPRLRPTRNEAGRPPNRSSESILLYANGAVGGASVSGSCDLPLQQSAKLKNSRHGNRGGQGMSGSGENKKWKCQRCTYENWPRAPKCTMCLGPKTRTPSPPLSGAEGSAPRPPLLPSPHTLHSRAQPHSPNSHSPSPPNSNSSPTDTSTSPAVARAHSNSNDTCEANSNSKDPALGVGGFNANKGSNIPPGKDVLADPGAKSSRDRRISYGSNSRLKSDTDEVML